MAYSLKERKKKKKKTTTSRNNNNNSNNTQSSVKSENWQIEYDHEKKKKGKRKELPFPGPSNTAADADGCTAIHGLQKAYISTLCTATVRQQWRQRRSAGCGVLSVSAVCCHTRQSYAIFRLFLNRTYEQITGGSNKGNCTRHEENKMTDDR